MRKRKYKISGVVALIGSFVILLAIAASFIWYMNSTVVTIFSAPEKFTRRADQFTVNISGMTSRSYKLGGEKLLYKINDSTWKPIIQNHPRGHSRHFRIELSHNELNEGSNELTIMGKLKGLSPQYTTVLFDYDPSPVQLPMTVDWSSPHLEVEDGSWESFEINGERRVRPIPGQEGYDRIVIVTGAFEGGRRVHTDMIFRHHVLGDWWAFGVLTMWGGRPDRPGVMPRLGWSFGLAWYWNRFEGFGNEFSIKYGNQPPEWVTSYRNLEIEPNVRYLMTAECWPEITEQGKHLRYRQRVKIWKEGDKEPEHWIETSDDEGAALPVGEYGVGLLTYWSQVDFGAVTIEPMDPVVVSN